MIILGDRLGIEIEKKINAFYCYMYVLTLYECRYTTLLLCALKTILEVQKLFKLLSPY